MALIACEDVALGYEGRAILEHLSFSVEAGEYLCVVGENGSGKTTLMKTLLGLQPPLGGRIVRERDLLRGGVGYVPQQTAAQRDFPASVEEVVCSGCVSRRPFLSRAEKARAAEAMERMGIGHLAKRCCRELSGGQRQRVLLARAFCAAGRVLVLDEPAASLDPAASEELYRLVEELNRRDGIAVVMVTHDLPAALRYAGRILHIGRTVFWGAPEAYRQSGLAGGRERGGEAP